MGDHLDRIIDLRRRKRPVDDDAAAPITAGADVELLERISVYLELIDNADSRAQALAGMAGTALGVFFAAFIAAFVTESGNPSPILKVADLLSEILFVVGAFALLRCIFQSLQPSRIEDPWNEDELRAHWLDINRVHENAARNFWIGTVLLAMSIGILIGADVLLDLGVFPSPMGS